MAYHQISKGNDTVNLPVVTGILATTTLKLDQRDLYRYTFWSNNN
jgi:hypothetical protein